MSRSPDTRRSVLYLVDPRYRAFPGEGGNVHIRAMRAAFASFLPVHEPRTPVSLAILCTIARTGRPRHRWKLLEALALATGTIEKIAACARHRPRFAYVRHEVPELPTLVALRLLRIPVALEVNAVLAHEVPIADRGSWFWHLKRALERQAFGLADTLFCVSAFLRDELVALGIPGDRLVVTHNGIDPQDFPERLVTPLPPRLTTLGFIGTGHRWHGLPALARALALLAREGTGVSLLMLGPGNAAFAEEVERLSLGPLVEITGQLPRDQALARSQEIGIAVLPDNLPHGSSLKIFEYMALGKAIVAARTPALSEILADGETALLIEPGNPEALAAACRRLLGDPELAVRLGENARRCVLASYTWEGNARTVLARFAPETLVPPAQPAVLP